MKQLRDLTREELRACFYKAEMLLDCVQLRSSSLRYSNVYDKLNPEEQKRFWKLLIKEEPKDL